MPLTRHFYALDEVQAAIVYAGSRGIAKETAFWCHELIQSGHASEAISALFESWLWHRGPFHLSWFLEAMKRLGGSEISEEDIVWMAYQLSACSIKDHSLAHLFMMSATDPESLFDRVTPRVFPAPFPSEDPLEHFFLRAIHQHKAGAAWWAGLRLSVDRWWWLVEWYRDTLCPGEEQMRALKALFEAAGAYDSLLGYRSEEYDRAIRGLVLLTLCVTTEQRQKSLAGLRLDKSGSGSSSSGNGSDCGKSDNGNGSGTSNGNEWNAVIGRRAGRMYPIPYHGLYGVTARGRMRQSESTVNDLFDVRKGIQGCAFWEEVIETEGESAFYSTYFPDDIPDEWTAVEKEKSHGSGILQRTEEVTLWGYLRRYLSGRCRLLWNKRPKGEVLQAVGLGESPFHTLLSLPVEPFCSVDVSLLRPVHKRKVVLSG
jgi:hypothetical protein